jgi:hypothetical protein
VFDRPRIPFASGRPAGKKRPTIALCHHHLDATALYPYDLDTLAVSLDRTAGLPFIEFVVLDFCDRDNGPFLYPSQ